MSVITNIFFKSDTKKKHNTYPEITEDECFAINIHIIFFQISRSEHCVNIDRQVQIVFSRGPQVE